MFLDWVEEAIGQTEKWKYIRRESGMIMELGPGRGRRDKLKDTEESFILMNWTVGHAQAHKNTCVGERRDGEKAQALGLTFLSY